jgi:hypothetical protein
MELADFVKEHKRLIKTLASGSKLEQFNESKRQYKELKEKLEAEKTPEQKAKERSDKALAQARFKNKLKLFQARKALKPIDGKKTEPVKDEPVKAEPKKYMPSKITTAWTAFVQKKGGVTEAAAAKKADNKTYLAFVEKWKKDNQ